MRKLTDARSDHRPWPLPSAPWVMFMQWRDLLFAHWPVPAEQLRPLIPSALSIDTWNGQAWIGIVPFHMTDVGPRALPPVPGISAFPEINVRSYVTFGGKPGVWFFSLDARQKLAVRAARWGLHLPYFDAEITVGQGTDGKVAYRSHRTEGKSPPAEFVASYWPSGPVFHPHAGTLEYWLIERYCLYSASPAGKIRRLEIHHDPWSLQVAEAEIPHNTMTRPLGVDLPADPPKLHYSKRQDAFAWLPAKIEI